MKYFNVTTLNLRGRHHPAISELVTSRSVNLACPHIKLLSGNYLTYGIRAKQNGGSPSCRICTTKENESICHIISQCSALHDTRERFIPEYKQLCKETVNNIDFDLITEDAEKFCQFILDPTSLNLPTRVNVADPAVLKFFKLSRIFCYNMDKSRSQLLKAKS